jgi:hypothetical protein
MGLVGLATGWPGVGSMVSKTRGRGATYNMSPPPQSGGMDELRNWCVREFERISDATSEGRSRGARWDILANLPEKPMRGDVNFFAAGVVGPGSLEGAYEYDVGAGTWRKL